MEDDSNLYNSLIDKYLYDYHAIIAYEEDIPRDKLCNYCIKNNIKFIGFFEEENFKMINSESLIKSKTFDGPKKLILKSNEGEGEK